MALKGSPARKEKHNMKRCPTCNKTFTDLNLSFCIEDGTPLVKTDSAYDSEATLASPSSSAGNSDVTQTYDQRSAPSDWKGPVYQPPGSFAAAPKKQKLWPWVVGIAALLLIVAGLGVAAVIYVPKIIREARNQSASSNSNSNRSDANKNANANNGNSNSPVSNTNQNTNSNDNGNSGTPDNSQPPADHETVLQNLKDIEDEWTVANINADKKKLQRILADDYVGTDSAGKMQGKADYIRDIKRDTSIKHWHFEDLKLDLKGDRATLSGTVTFEVAGQSEDLVLSFTDKFVWRDARWQAVGSEVSRVK